MEVQYELNLEDKTDAEVKIDLIQKQVDATNESMGKVRRKLFAEVGELKKMILALQQDNAMLKNQVAMLLNQRTEWVYSQNEELFSIKAG